MEEEHESAVKTWQSMEKSALAPKDTEEVRRKREMELSREPAACR